MLIAIVQFVALATVIIAAGTMLAHYADGIAEATGLGRLLIGSVLLAGATSLPELTVDIAAVRLNLPDMAMGDLLGSSLMNLLILAALDLTHHSGGKMLSRTAAAHALSGLFSIALTGLVGLGLLTARKAENWAFLGIHAWVWVIAIGYALGVRMVFLDQRIATRAAEESITPPEEARPPMPLWKAGLGFLIAALVIVLTGPYLAHAAGTIAELARCGVPSILVPYPHAADNHQTANARFLEQQGGGLVVEQPFIDGLHKEVLEVILNDWLLSRMRSNLGRVDGVDSLKAMIQDVERLSDDPRVGKQSVALQMA